MSADLLRRAASLMRERAEKATTGPWEFRPRRGFESMGNAPATIGFTDEAGHFVMLREGTWATEGDMGYIASWHPAVALAVALLLDNEASLIDSVQKYPDLHQPLNETRVEMLTDIARAYLGESA